MEYRIAAALVLLLHLAFIAFVVAGAALAYRRRWVLALHLPAALWGCWVELSGAGCPLTLAENWFRIRGGAAGYGEDFVEHYLLAAIYPAGLTRATQLVLAALVVLSNIILYTLVLTRQPRQTGMSELPPADEP
jgi:hypothetical protein